MIHIYNEIGDLHSPDDISLVNAIPSDIRWNRMNSNPTVRTIYETVSDYEITYHLFPAKFQNEWYVGYVIKEMHSHDIDMYQKGVTVYGISNANCKFNNDDNTLLDGIKDTSNFTYSNI